MQQEAQHGRVAKDHPHVAEQILIRRVRSVRRARHGTRGRVAVAVAVAAFRRVVSSLAAHRSNRRGDAFGFALRGDVDVALRALGILLLLLIPEPERHLERRETLRTRPPALRRRPRLLPRGASLLLRLGRRRAFRLGRLPLARLGVEIELLDDGGHLSRAATVQATVPHARVREPRQPVHSVRRAQVRHLVVVQRHEELRAEGTDGGDAVFGVVRSTQSDDAEVESLGIADHASESLDGGAGAAEAAAGKARDRARGAVGLGSGGRGAGRVHAPTFLAVERGEDEVQV